MSHSGKGYRNKVGFFGYIRRLFMLLLLAALGATGYWFYQRTQEIEVVKQMISRLTAEERVAEVLVEEYQRDADGQLRKVRLKILEYDWEGKPLLPKFCTFHLNDIIHFEGLVIRLNDELIMEGKGKSAFLFRRAFSLDQEGNTYESCDISKPLEVPTGYSLGTTDKRTSQIEKGYWESFWLYALDEEERKRAGIKNAQIEAPATRFVPDRIYRLVLEYDGGLRIQANSVPEILKQEGKRLRPKDTTLEVDR